MSRLIITAEESVCDALEQHIKEHPLVEHTFQNSGFWYSNGETGPEWFTLTIEADYSKKDEVESLVDTALKELGKSAGNRFWG